VGGKLDQQRFLRFKVPRLGFLGEEEQGTKENTKSEVVSFGLRL
jgi:hypothetical protein